MVVETRYVTVSGLPPNGGVPFGTVFYTVSPPPPAFITPPNSPNRGPDLPPPYNAQQNDGNGRAYQPYGPPAPAPPAPAPAPRRLDHEAPGQWLEGHGVRENGWCWLFPSDSEITTINFIPDVTSRPVHFEQYKMATRMTVGDLMHQLGAPEGNQYGITEMYEQGNDRFTAGITIMQGSADANRTLRDVGWTATRCATGGPVWIVVNAPWFRIGY